MTALDDDTRWLCPVWGAATDQGHAPLQLLSIRDDRGVVVFRLVSIADDERRRLAGGAAHLPVSSLQIHHARAAIETNAPAVFGAEPIRENGLRVCALALSMWCDEVSVPFCFLTKGGPADAQSLTSTQLDPFVPSGLPTTCLITDEMRSALPRVASAMAAHYGRIAGAAMRFYWAGHKPFLVDAVLDYAIAAEWLLCRGAEHGVSATFRRRAGKLYERSGGEAAAGEQVARDVYNLRSKIAHGDDEDLPAALEPWRGDIRAARRDVRRFVRDVFLAFIASPSLLTPEGLAELDS